MTNIFYVIGSLTLCDSFNVVNSMLLFCKLAQNTRGPLMCDKTSNVKLTNGESLNETTFLDTTSYCTVYLIIKK